MPSRHDFYGVDVIESWAASRPKKTRKTFVYWKRWKLRSHVVTVMFQWRPVVGIASGELRHLIEPDKTGYTADQELGAVGCLGS